MRTRITAGRMALAIGAVAVVSSTDAEAQRWRCHHHHGGWGAGAAGFAAGAIIGETLASRPYYGSRYL